MPIGVHVSPKMEISVILPKLMSLHEIIYTSDRTSGLVGEGLDLEKKM